MRCVFLISAILFNLVSFGQDYNKKLLDSAYVSFRNGDFVSSAKYFELAATTEKYNNVTVRYNAACAWARAGMKDKAFHQLNSVVSDFSYDKLSPITTDDDLRSLHEDPRWHKLIMRITDNQLKRTINIPLKLKLDSVNYSDNYFRVRLDSFVKTFGWESQNVKLLVDSMRYQDSVNLEIVSGILDSQGWPNSKVVGIHGVTAVFLVIQHSNIEIQKKYLPMLRKASEFDSENKYNLAYLEDRVRIKEQLKQIYGTQYYRDSTTNDLKFYPIEDEENVNSRRLNLGLNTIEEYAKDCGIPYRTN